MALKMHETGNYRNISKMSKVEKKNDYSMVKKKIKVTDVKISINQSLFIEC